jgi:hypothetical protein
MSDAAPARERHEEREEKWIKSWCSLDLKGMRQTRRAGRAARSGAPMTSAGRRKPTDDGLAFDIRRDMIHLCPQGLRSA